MSRHAKLEKCFPGLGGSGYRVTSDASVQYNCVAWAADDATRWWEPDPAFIYFWPPGAPREYTVDAYVEAFASLGYRICPDGQPAAGLRKIAIFYRDDSPQHVARQLPNGNWTSKCGQLEDIEHDLHALEGEMYGVATIFLARAVP